MPIATLGCMRFQQTWGTEIENMDKIKSEVQQNMKDIFKYSISKLGMNHIETAQMYGTSQLQIGALLQELYEEGVTTREELIIQTKVNPTNAKDFRATLDNTYKLLQVDYLDMLSFHGLNYDSHYDLIFNNPNEGEENLIDIVKEYQKEGKIRHIGFSTHAQPELIRKCIETDAFAYVNLHYHYFGSYTASGGGQYGGNLENIRLMKEKDMGIFVISAYDKGGRLYAPSKKLRSLTLPELEPILFGSLWLWAHQDIDEENCHIHTFTVGAARPSDLDEPAVAAYLFRTRKDEMLEKVKTVTKKLDDARIKAVGEDWVKSWFEGVPNCSTEDDSYMLGQIVSLYNMIQAWGLLDYAKDRYGKSIPFIFLFSFYVCVYLIL
jgi:predicted aldo/keto reductase-like oxidoreductase